MLGDRAKNKKSASSSVGGQASVRELHLPDVERYADADNRQAQAKVELKTPLPEPLAWVLQATPRSPYVS